MASLTTLARADLDWPSLLTKALTGEGLSAHFQPIVDVERGTVVGYEALARFEGYAVRDPETWFEAARVHGQLAGLEAVALRTALLSRKSLPANAFLTVNLGPDVLDAPEVREVLIAERDLAGLVVELTEHARVDSYAALEPAIERLRGAGAMLAIDDAGSGYAGLTHLLRLRPEFLKLDRALVSGLQHDEAKRTLVEMVGVLAGRLDAWLLAEGVETREELDCLVRLGVPLVQGFHLARPDRAWPSLDIETSLHLISTARLRGNTTLRALLEAAPAAQREDDPRSWFADDTTDVVVVVDSDLRPVAIASPGQPLTSIVRDLRINLDTEVDEAALRAITRPADRRLAPLVCTDNAGRYVGIVRMERIVHLLASSAGPRLDAPLVRGPMGQQA